MKACTIFTALGMAFLLMASSCQQASIPRPKGYFRIALHDTSYRQLAPECPVVLELATNTQLHMLVPGQDSSWFNIVYPEYGATVYCTFIQDEDLDALFEDAFQMAYEHEVKADAIGRRRFDSLSGGYGFRYRITGDAASPWQFALCDGSGKFLRGSLYFNCRTNADSLLPVVDRIGRDLDHLIETISWAS